MAGPVILVIDDDAGIRSGIRDFLEAQGYEVEEADSGRRAEEAFRASAPDAAVLDYRLPDGDALTLLPRLKEIDPAVPVVILTDHGSIGAPSTRSSSSTASNCPESRRLV
jgi:DNA-binding NtrC family response regulator